MTGNNQVCKQWMCHFSASRTTPNKWQKKIALHVYFGVASHVSPSDWEIYPFYNWLIYNRGSLHILKIFVTLLPVQRNDPFSFYMIYLQEAIRWLRLYSYKTHLLALDCVFFCLWDPDAYYPWIKIQLLPPKQMAGPKIWNSLPRNVRNVKNCGNEHFWRSTKNFSCKSAWWSLGGHILLFKAVIHYRPNMRELHLVYVCTRVNSNKYDFNFSK